MDRIEELLYRAREKAARFMEGRNGLDSLNRACLIAYAVLYVLRMIAAVFLRSIPLSQLLGLLYTVTAVGFLFRFFSRNLSRRRMENQRWLALRERVRGQWEQVKRLGSGAAARHADREHRYFTCKACGTVCRVPKGKGKIVITCPKCGAQIKAKS